MCKRARRYVTICTGLEYRRMTYHWRPSCLTSQIQATIRCHMFWCLAGQFAVLKTRWSVISGPCS